MKLKITYTLESIYDLPGEQNYQERIFICEVHSFYEWRNLLYLAVKPTYDQEIFVKEVKEIDVKYPHVWNI
jgi:hypothetical protein